MHFCRGCIWWCDIGLNFAGSDVHCFYCFVFEEIVRCWDFYFVFSKTKGDDFEGMRETMIF